MSEAAKLAESDIQRMKNHVRVAAGMDIPYAIDMLGLLNEREELLRQRDALLSAAMEALVDLRVARLLSEKGFDTTIAKLQATIEEAER